MLLGTVLLITNSMLGCFKTFKKVTSIALQLSSHWDLNRRYLSNKLAVCIRSHEICRDDDDDDRVVVINKTDNVCIMLY